MKGKKEEKRSVGRPKLADQKMIKDTKSMIISSFTLLLVLVIGGIYSLTNVNLDRTVGTTSTTGKCYISSISSEKNKRTVKYTVNCTSGAKISDTKYQVAGEKMISRDSDKRKVTKGEIIFKESRIGKSLKLRVYYNDNKKYDEKTIVVGSGKTVTEKETTTTTRQYSKNPATEGTVTSKDYETYSVVKAGDESNVCRLNLINISGKTIKYQIVCQANGRPISVLYNDAKEEKILDNFKNHKGYIGTHTYTASNDISKNAKLRLRYKKTMRNGDETDTVYKATKSLYENGAIKASGVEVAKLNTKNLPSDKCTISVSNVRTYKFKWTVKCDEGARPISVRLTESYNGREGSQIKGLPGGNSTKFGITKSEISKSYVKKAADYILVLYFGTKTNDYYKTYVSFTTPMTNPTTTTTTTTTQKATTTTTTTASGNSVSSVTTATTKPGTPKTTTAANKTTTKVEKKCQITSMGSAKGSNILKYKVACTGGAKIVTSKYKVGNGSFETRDKDKMKDMNSKIVFKQSRVGQKVTLRVYYTNNKYSEGNVVLGSGKTSKGN